VAVAQPNPSPQTPPLLNSLLPNSPLPNNPLLKSPPWAKKPKFAGLLASGAGSDEGTFAGQQAVVDEFNASQDKIELVLEIVDNDAAYDTLATQIAAGNAPDIVGPVGIRGRDSFKGAWLDLQP
jgi:multiple sugar transport system substrate-binding protein